MILCGPWEVRPSRRTIALCGVCQTSAHVLREKKKTDPDGVDVNVLLGIRFCFKDQTWFHRGPWCSSQNGSRSARNRSTDFPAHWSKMDLLQHMCCFEPMVTNFIVEWSPLRFRNIFNITLLCRSREGAYLESVHVHHQTPYRSRHLGGLVNRSNQWMKILKYYGNPIAWKFEFADTHHRLNCECQHQLSIAPESKGHTPGIHSICR